MAAMGGQIQRVQKLSETGVKRLPKEYVQPVESRSSSGDRSCGGDLDLPIIDLFSFDPAGSEDIKRDIGIACKEWGVFQVVNHKVSGDLLDRVLAAGKSFFHLPEEEKLRYSCDPNSPASEGYGSKMLSTDDAVLDWRDYFDHHSLPLFRRNPSRWPDLGDYREVMTDYSDKMVGLAGRILCLISESLGLSPSYIEEAIGEVFQNITISYYPPCPQPELALGLQSHSDMGAITLLIQDDVGGLEVFKNGQWIPVAPLPGAIVVILADQTEIITNGEYKSCVHRAVVNSQKPRISVAAFYDPSKSVETFPAPPLLDGGRAPARYRRVVYEDYVSSWYGKGPDGRRNIDALLL